MQIHARVSWRSVFLFPLFVLLTVPLAAQDKAPYPFQKGSVGTPFRAYRAGIGHTRADTRPLDGSRRTPVERYAAPPKPVADWSGFYFGASAGGILGTADLEGSLSSGIETDGYALTGHAGKNWQIGSTVFGIEADATTTSADGLERFNSAVTTKTELDWLASARLRAGYAYENFLFYGTAGVALATTEAEITTPGFRFVSHDVHTGYVVGAGAEVQIVNGVAARLEALHYGFSGETLPTPTGNSDLDLDVTTVRAGLSLKFN